MSRITDAIAIFKYNQLKNGGNNEIPYKITPYLFPFNLSVQEIFSLTGFHS